MIGLHGQRQKKGLDAPGDQECLGQNEPKPQWNSDRPEGPSVKFAPETSGNAPVRDFWREVSVDLGVVQMPGGRTNPTECPSDQGRARRIIPRTARNVSWKLGSVRVCGLKSRIAIAVAARAFPIA